MQRHSLWWWIAGCVLVGSVLSGCGQAVEREPPSDLRYASSGQRLKARYYVADGAEQFRVLHDDQLGIDCEFVPDVSGDGVHCVPKTVTDVFYLGSHCTEPVMAIQTTGSRIAGVSRELISGLVATPELPCQAEPATRVTYRIGAQIYMGGLDSITSSTAVPIPPVYARKGSKCEVTSPQRGLLPPDLHRLEPVDPSLLVAGTLSTIDVGGGLSARRVMAEDATQITLGVLGLDHGPCRLLADGLCLPEPSATDQAGVYLDDQCEQRGFVSAAVSTCHDVHFAATSIDDVLHVYELAAAPRAFMMNAVDNPAMPPGTDFEYRCEAISLDTVRTDYQWNVSMLGKDVTSTLPKADVLRTGKGELHLVRFAAANPNRADNEHFVALDAGDQFVDDQGHGCHVYEAVDGSLRCLPNRPEVTEASYWKDAACTERLYQAVDATTNVSELRVVRWQDDQYFQTIETLFRLEPYDGPLYGIDETRCVPEVPAFRRVLALAAEEPFTALPSVEVAEL